MAVPSCRRQDLHFRGGTRNFFLKDVWIQESTTTYSLIWHLPYMTFLRLLTANQMKYKSSFNTSADGADLTSANSLTNRKDANSSLRTGSSVSFSRHVQI